VAPTLLLFDKGDLKNFSAERLEKIFKLAKRTLAKDIKPWLTTKYPLDLAKTHCFGDAYRRGNSRAQRKDFKVFVFGF